jgi:hypothetical protein
MARFGQASIGSPECSVRSASSHTTPAQAAPRVPLLQRRITNLSRGFVFRECEQKETELVRASKKFRH